MNSQCTLSTWKMLTLALLLVFTTALPAADKVQSRISAPELVALDLSGKTQQLKRYRGQVVLVNFWATWCPPCRAEMPSLWRLKQKLKDKPFQVITVNMGENRETIAAFLPEQMQRDFIVLRDSDAASLERWQVTALPATYLLDRQGRIAYSILGAMEWDQAASVARINRLLAE